MSANFHTPIPVSMPLTTTNIESPLSELDTAIGNLRDGAIDFHQLNLGSFSSKTISSGSISVNTSSGDRTLITIDTQGGSATDDLDTIQGSVSGDLLVMKIANNSRIVILKHNIDNIKTYNGLDIVMSDVNQLVTLLYNGSAWVVLPDVTQSLSFDSRTTTIVSGAISYLGSVMTVDTESAAVTDDLATINGGVDGAILWLRIVDDSRVVVLKNSGNISLPSGNDVTLSSYNKYILLVYNSTSSKWIAGIESPISLNSTYGASTINTSSNQFEVPFKLFTDGVNSYHPLSSTSKPYLDIMPQGGLRQPRILTAANTTLEGSGFGTLTVSGTPTNNFGDGGANLPGSIVRFASGASSGNKGGISSPFTLTSTRCNPYFRIVFRTYSSIATCRFWIGLSSAVIGNTDDLTSAGTEFMGLRYSTVATDAFWTFVGSDGSTQDTVVTTVAAAINSSYELIMTVDQPGSLLKFYFRNLSSGSYYESPYDALFPMPIDTTALGLEAHVETREAVAKSLQIYGVALYH